MGAHQWWEERASLHQESAKALDAEEFGEGLTYKMFMEHTDCLNGIEKAFPGAMPALEVNRKVLKVRHVFGINTGPVSNIRNSGNKKLPCQSRRPPTANRSRTPSVRERAQRDTAVDHAVDHHQ